MSPLLTEPAETGLAPPQRPSFWRVGIATFLGYLLAVLVLIPLTILVSLVGLNVVGAPGRGVFFHYDLASWAAEACVGLPITFVTALAVGWQLRIRTGWEVPFGFTFGVLLLTGYAPALALTPFYEVAAPISLAIAAVLLRWRCEPSGAEPRTALGSVPRRYRRAVAIGVAVAGPLMFGYALAYAATHPLRITDSAEPVYASNPGQEHRYVVWLETAGSATVTDLEVAGMEGGPALQLERAGVEDMYWPGRGTLPLRPLSRVRIEDWNGPVRIALELRQGRQCTPGGNELEAIRLRYTVLGTRQEQRLPLPHRPGVRC